MRLEGGALSIGYPGHVVGRGLDVALDTGEVLALLGPNGGGKTTLLKTLLGLLKEIGRVYPPVMLANAKALMSGAEQVEAVVEGLPWRQPPFPYQAKCLQWLRASHGALSGASRAQVDALMAASGCAAMFA